MGWERVFLAAADQEMGRVSPFAPLACRAAFSSRRKRRSDTTPTARKNRRVRSSQSSGWWAWTRFGLGILPLPSTRIGPSWPMAMSHPASRRPGIDAAAPTASSFAAGQCATPTPSIRAPVSGWVAWRSAASRPGFDLAAERRPELQLHQRRQAAGLEAVDGRGERGAEAMRRRGDEGRAAVLAAGDHADGVDGAGKDRGRIGVLLDRRLDQGDLPAGEGLVRGDGTPDAAAAGPRDRLDDDRAPARLRLLQRAAAERQEAPPVGHSDQRGRRHRLRQRAVEEVEEDLVRQDGGGGRRIDARQPDLDVPVGEEPARMPAVERIEIGALRDEAARQEKRAQGPAAHPSLVAEKGPQASMGRKHPCGPAHALVVRRPHSKESGRAATAEKPCGKPCGKLRKALRKAGCRAPLASGAAADRHAAMAQIAVERRLADAERPGDLDDGQTALAIERLGGRGGRPGPGR